MEQQTISISKAGMTTRLNARTSILCAANPVYGRYNRQKSPHDNVNLPYSLLSRFDLMFILLDNADSQIDNYLAKHITYQHTGSSMVGQSKDLFSMDELKKIIAKARTFNPFIPEYLHEDVVKYYQEMRQKNKNQEQSLEYSYITPRTLLSIIRLAQAHAKLRFSNEVNVEDIKEAIGMMESARSQLQDEKSQNLNQRMKKTETSASHLIYRKLVKFLRNGPQHVKDCEN